MIDLGQTRWLMFEQGATSVSKPLVIMMVFWLTIVFISWGIFAPRNATIVATLFVAALSVSGAIFLILEMYTPYAGLIRISSAPLRATLAHLGQ
jgi:membrane-bound ClpP family serine protease